MTFNLSKMMEFLQQDDGGFSSKRLVTFICALLIVIGFCANMFFGFRIDEFIFNSIRDIAVAGLGFTGLEKLMPKLKNGDSE